MGVDRLFVPVGFAGVGALIAVRTSNKVGGLFLAEGFAVAHSIATKDYAAYPGGTPLPGVPWVGWVFTIALNTIFPPLLRALPHLARRAGTLMFEVTEQRQWIRSCLDQLRDGTSRDGRPP